MFETVKGFERFAWGKAVGVEIFQRIDQRRRACRLWRRRGGEEIDLQVGRALIQYVQRLAGLPARHKLDDTLRQEFLDEGRAIEPDVGTISNVVNFGTDGEGNLYMVEITGGEIFELEPLP